jgi:hypothetical protein
MCIIPDYGSHFKEGYGKARWSIGGTLLSRFIYPFCRNGLSHPAKRVDAFLQSHLPFWGEAIYPFDA